MKFSQYTPVVSPEMPGGASVHMKPTATDRMPMAGRGAQAMAAAIGQVGKFIQEKQDEADSADVMEARNKIMGSLTSQMYGENGLMTTGVGENAKGLEGRVTEAIQKTFGEISGKYNKRVQTALRGTLNENMANYQRLAAQQEGREFVKQKEINYSSALALNADAIAASYDNPQVIESMLKDSLNLVNYRAADQGWGGAQYEAEKRAKLTALLSGAIDNAIADGNTAQAEALLGTYAGGMSQESVMKWQKQIRQEGSAKANREMGEWLFQNFKDDPEGARKYIYDKLAQETEYIGGGGVSSIDGLMAAIGGQESGGDYNAENGRTGAHGKYQIMPENWPSWAEEAGLGADAPRTPENQEAVARYKLGQYLQQYGPEGAMVAWYSGPANAERWVNGESTDIYGRSWDAKNGNGDEPSIREYVQQVSARGGGDGVSSKELDSDIDADGVDLTGTLPETIAMVNRANQIHKEMFGSSLWVSCTTGGHAAGTQHAMGRKADVGSDALAKSQANRDAFDARLKAEGIGSVNEYDHPSAGSTGGHFDLNVTGEDWLNGTNHGGFKVGSGGHSRRKYTEAQLNAIWQQYQARVSDNKKAQTAASNQRTEAWIGQLKGMSQTEAATFLEQVKNDADYPEYSKVLTAARAYFPDMFKKGKSGSGSGRTYYTGGSGSRYTANQIEDAKAMFEEYEERRNDPAETISRTDQRRYNKAARILNDVQGNSGDNLSSKEALKLARHAVAVTANDEEAEWYLITNGEFTESEARAYVEMVHGDEEG